MTGPAKSKCEACDKSTLSLLLLRPSPIAKTAPLKASGSDSVASDAAVMAGLLPAKTPTESRFALRLLREGYVYLHIEAPPAGVKSWYVYRVSATGDLIEQKNGLFELPEKVTACRQPWHNPTGFKLLCIPNAHLLMGKKLWVAYSANLWNDALRNKNKANPQAMQKISLAGGSPNTFKPTAANLKSKVLECALSGLQINSATDHDFAFNSVAASVDNLAESLEKAAARHPKTKGKEIAVVLRDPVGIATELNELRLRRNSMAQHAINQKLAEPDNAYALNSSNTLMSIKTLYEDVAFAQALDKWATSASWREYTDPRPTTPFSLMGRTTAPLRWTGGTWEDLPDERVTERRLAPHTQGRVWYSESASRALSEGKKEARKAWEDLEDEYAESKRKQWHIDFDAAVTKEHLDPLARFEADWWAARQDDKFNLYFALHFDENDPNKLTARHCPGLVYAAEVNRAATPAPFTAGAVLAEYLKELTADVSQPSAILLRSLVANQAAVIKKMQEVISLTETTHDKRNDKLYDLGAALVLKATGAASPKYAWLAAAMGNAMGGYAIAVVGSLGAAYSAAVAVGLATAAGLPATRLAAISLVQRATDLALQSIISNTRLNTPILITKRFQAGRGMFLLTRGGRFSWPQARGLIREGHIDIVLHSDTNEMRKAAGDMDQALLDKNAGHVSIPGQYPPAIMVNHAALAGTITLNEDKFIQLYTRGGTKWGGLINTVKTAYGEMDKQGAIMRSLEGRLALGVILLNGKGALDAISQLNDPKLSELARLEARLALTDGVSSVLAAILQLREIVFKSQIETQLGSQGAAKALEKVVTTHSLRAAGFFLGAVAGVANTWWAWVKFERAREDGHTPAMIAYFGSLSAFAGMTGTFALQGIGALAQRALAKGISNSMMRAVALRLAARYGAASTLGLTGWGTALLALAVVFEIGAVALTPTAMEAWVSRTKFGKGSKKKFTSWAEEEAALLALFAPKSGEAKSAPARAGAPA